MNTQISTQEIRETHNTPAQAPFQVFSLAPLLEDVLHNIGPLPSEALFLGQAEDGLPLLFNLHDPAPGPLLIIGEPGSGKTDLLRMLAEFVIDTHTPREIQFAVITRWVDEWQGPAVGEPHCVGVFPSQGCAAQRLVQSLAAWMIAKGSREQSVLLLIDGLSDLQNWDMHILRCLHQILTDGPTRRVWVIASTSSENPAPLKQAQGLFRTRIYSQALSGQRNETARTPNAPWFSIRERGKWLHFWIPSPGY